MYETFSWSFFFCTLPGPFFGRCRGHACPRLALRLARALKCSGLGHSGVQDKTMACLIPMTMPGPYLDLVWISFTSKLHIYKKFSRLHHLGPSDISMKFHISDYLALIG